MRACGDVVDDDDHDDDGDDDNEDDDDDGSYGLRFGGWGSSCSVCRVQDL